MFDWIKRAKDVTNVAQHAIIATGNTPDGELHIGALREQLVADAIARAMLPLRQAAQIFVVYDWDGLKPAHAPRPIESWIGTPLVRIPCAESHCPSYAEHNLGPYLRALSELGVVTSVIRTSHVYQSGALDNYILLAEERADDIREVLRLAPDAPIFFPLCPSCTKYCYRARIGATAECKSCGQRFPVEPAGQFGKLRWEVEWAALWAVYGVSLEPIGPIHTSLKGMTYDRAADIASFVFQANPPVSFTFGTVEVTEPHCDVSRDAQCCRRNIKLMYEHWREIAPAAILRYVMLREDSGNRVRIRIKDDLPTYYRDFAILEEACLGGGASEEQLQLYRLSLTAPETRRVLGGSFAQAVALSSKPTPVVQATPPVLMDPVGCIANMQTLTRYAQSWLTEWEGQAGSLPANIRGAVLTSDERRAVRRVMSLLSESTNGLEAVRIASGESGLSVGVLFKLIYWVLLGQPSGPPLAQLVSSLEFGTRDGLF